MSEFHTASRRFLSGSSHQIGSAMGRVAGGGGEFCSRVFDRRGPQTDNDRTVAECSAADRRLAVQVNTTPSRLISGLTHVFQLQLSSPQRWRVCRRLPPSVAALSLPAARRHHPVPSLTQSARSPHHAVRAPPAHNPRPARLSRHHRRTMHPDQAAVT